MKPERWRKIEELYHAAQSCSANERGAFLAKACQGDDELQSQIQALLAQEEGGKILDSPAAELLTASIDHHDSRSLSAGDQIGPYKIIGLIGAGGMGEVYRARDPRLRRDVALKVLPTEVSRDPVRRQRFEREARTVAALNHPNIVSIHDVGEDEGVYFIATELVEGEPLRAAPLGLRKTLDIAVQIASGLAAAHEAGIVHRDLKPANILLTRDGQVKILDFGLAKLGDKLGGTASDGSAKSETLKTQPGMIMGTPSYMSPEQVKAEPIDHRSDIFSFGVILYELLAGRRAFQGVTAEVMAAILNTDPPELPETVPSGVRRIVAHCLEKDPAKRFQSAGDLKFALTEVAQGSGSGSLSPARALGGHGKWAWIVAAVMSLAAAAFAFAYFTRNTPDAAVRFSFAPPFKTDAIGVAMSPDGTRIAFADAAGRSAIWLRSVESFGVQKLAGTEGARSLFWSPDGRSLGYFSGRLGVKRIDFSGGQTAAQTVTTSAGFSAGAAWSSQGVILYQPDNAGSGLYRVLASGGAPTPATRLNSARKEIAHRFPQFLPDGRHFIYWVWSTLEENTGEYVGSLDPEEKLPDGPLVRTWREAHYTEPGYLLFLQGSTLMARRFDAASQRFTGEPHQLSEQIGVWSQFKGQALFSTSATGALVYQEFLPQPQRSIVLRDRTGNQLRTFEAPSGSVTPTLDPLERHVAVEGLDANDQLELWSVDLERGIRYLLTAGHSASGTPLWSPDGQRIAFTSNRSGTYDLYAANASGTGDEELLVKSSHTKAPTDWSKDGQFLVYFEIDPVTKFDIWVLPLKGDRKPIPFLKTEFNEWWGRLSPVPDRQGHLWMAYLSDETGSYQIYIRPFLPDAPVSSAGTKVRVSAEGVADYCWRKDGKELFYTEQGKLMTVDVKLGNIAEIGTPHKLFDISPGTSGFTAFGDGQRFLFIEPAGEPPAPKINVVLNWTAGLKR